MEDTDEFNTLAFEKKLTQLKDTQESIQALSSWCLKQRNNHKKIVSSWLNVLKRVKVEQRLTLFYLANDVIQYSKRKNYEFVSSWGCYLQKATPLVRDEKVRKKILRIFKIWEERSVYDEEFLSDLTGLLIAGATKKTADDDSNDFQPQQLVNKIRQCTSLENDTDTCLKYIHDSHLELSDADALCASLKDKRNTDEVEKDLNEGISCVEKYTQALQREILARDALIVLLKSATQYYATQRGEVKVVALAYKTFGQRVKQLKRKLDDLVIKLPSAAPSPPERDEDVPSPGPDEDLDLPMAEGDDEVSYNIDKTFSTSLTADGSLYNVGLSSFLGTDMGINLFNEGTNNQANQDENVTPIHGNSDVKQIKAVNDDVDSISVASSSIKSQDTLPGLDLLTPDSTGSIPRPISFYGSVDTTNNEESEPYRADISNWGSTSTNWNMQGPNQHPPITNSLPMPGSMPNSLPGSMPNSLPGSIPNSLSGSMPNSLSGSMPNLLSASMPNSIPGPLQNSLPVSMHNNIHNNVGPMQAPLPVPMPTLYNPDTPESPASPVPMPHSLIPLTTIPHTPIYSQSSDLPPRDIDQRGILPPPPPPPILPSLQHAEDIDHRMLHPIPPPMPDLPTQNATDIDHRNLIPLTQAPPVQMPRGMGDIDQDYRIPPPMRPNDNIESVDMDLSEDEDLINMFSNQPDHFNSGPKFNPNDHRRNSFNPNNKVLVGGDNHRDNIKPPMKRTNSEPIQEVIKTPPVPEPLTIPPIVPLVNPFEALPKFDINGPPLNEFVNFADDGVAYQQMEGHPGEENYLDGPHNHFPDGDRNPSPPRHPPFMQANQRFQRNWNPVRGNFRQPPWVPFRGPPPRGPRPNNNRWMGPHRPRFW